MVPDYSSTGESELVSYLIDYHTNNSGGDGFANELKTVEPEAHYNHYGDRGVADLYVETVEQAETREYYHGHLYEVKSEHAVEQANGAGGIIRQFKRMKKYFFQDDSWRHPDTITYELVFLPTKRTLQHLTANKAMYQQLEDRSSYEDASSVFMRAPDGDMAPGIPFWSAEFDTVSKNLVYTRPDYARAAGVGIEAFHEVGRYIYEDD
jgi:hypothetical protein